MHKGEFSFSLCREERVGFVTPVYFWGLPDIVVRFINHLTITGLHHNFIYHVVTFGSTTGQAHYMMQELLKNKGLWLDAKYIVRMVDVWTPIFDVSNHEKCLRITEEAEKSIAKITGRDEVRRHLSELGLVVGEEVTVVIGWLTGITSPTETSARQSISK